MREDEEAVQQFSKSYAACKKQYPELPSLEEIDHEWDVLDIIGRERHFPRNTLRFVRWHLGRAVHGWGGYLHEFILPSAQSAVSMEEYNYFDEQEKQQIVKMMNWIMLKQREMNVLQLDEDDERTAQWIARCWEEWQTYKPLLRNVLLKNAQTWREKVANPQPLPRRPQL